MGFDRFASQARLWPDILTNFRGLRGLGLEQLGTRTMFLESARCLGSNATGAKPLKRRGYGATQRSCSHLEAKTEERSLSGKKMRAVR